MSALRQIWLMLLVLAAVLAAPAAAQPQFPPRPDGPVFDGANIIPDIDQQLLDARLREYNMRTGRSLIVATVPSLEGETIEQYAVRLFETWGIGGAETDQGLLLLIAPNERQMRIEVGYGLHQYVTDILSGRIIRDQITPHFRTNDFAGGINAGVDALITQLDRDPADAKAVAEAAAAAAAAERSRGGSGGAVIGGIIFWIALIVFFSFLFGRGARGRRFRGGGVGGAVGNVVMWTALNAAMNSGRGRGGGFGGGGFGGGGFGGGGGGFGGFGGGMSGGGGASGGW